MGRGPRTNRYVCCQITAVGSTTLPVGSIYSIAGVGFSLLEAGATSGTSSAKRGALRRLTTAGTPGAGGTEVRYDDDDDVPQATVFATHSVAPTLGDTLHKFALLAAAGLSILYSFHDQPIEVPPGTANGIGWVRTDVNTGGFEPVIWVWEE